MTARLPQLAQVEIGPPPAPLPLDGPLPDPLAGLRDIHLPGEVPFWPPAPGWYALAGLLAALALLAGFLEWRRRQTLAYKAQQELKAIARDAARYPEARDVAAACAILLRRVLLSRPDGSTAAAFTGEAWARFLGEGKAGMPQEIGAFLGRAPYLPPSSAGPVGRDELVAAVRRWIGGNA